MDDNTNTPQATSILDDVNATPVQVTNTPDTNNQQVPDPKEPQARSLLDDVNASTIDSKEPAPAGEPNAEPTQIEINDETIATFVTESGFDFTKDISIGTDALGDGEQFISAQMLKNLTPDLMKLGIPANKAGDALKLIESYERMQLEHNNKAAIAEINARAEASRKEFGKELGEVCQLAEQGGSAIFGDGLWEEIKGVPVLTNDKRFLRALAKVGRMLKTDKGTNARTSAGNDQNKSFSASAWIKSSSRYQ